MSEKRTSSSSTMLNESATKHVGGLGDFSPSLSAPFTNGDDTDRFISRHDDAE